MSPEQVVRDFYAAYGRRDVDAMMSYVSDDIVEDLSGIGLVTGARQEREFLTGLLASFPDLVTELTRVVASGDVVAVEWRRNGTFSGAPWRGLPASGRPFALRGGAFLEVREDKITRINGYYDTAEFARNIGALPPEGSLGERLGVAIFRVRVRVRRIARARDTTPARWPLSSSRSCEGSATSASMSSATTSACGSATRSPRTSPTR